MKNLFLSTCLFLASVSTATLQGASSYGADAALTKPCETLIAKDRGSKSSLPCLIAKHGTLKFNVNVLTLNLSGKPIPLTGTYRVNVYAPNGKCVGKTTIDASTLTPTTAGSLSTFPVTIKAPFYAGLYTLQVTNQSVTFPSDLSILSTLVIFLNTIVKNSRNSNEIVAGFPLTGELVALTISPKPSVSIFPVGTTLQQTINILPPFVKFKKCDE